MGLVKPVKKEELDTEKLNELIEDINASSESHRNYMLENGEDMKFYMTEHKNYLNDYHISGDVDALVKLALAQGINEFTIVEAIEKHSSVEVDGIHCPDNYLESWIIGEQEIQVDGLKEKLEELTSDEFRYVAYNCDAYIGDKPTDWIYLNMDYDVYYLIPDLNKLAKALKLKKLKAVK